MTQRIARDLYDRNLPDLTAVYFEGTDEVGHVFASFTPPRPPCSAIRDEDAARYERVVAAYYGVVDRILGQWMRRAEEDGATLVVTSDHGFKWGDDRPCGFASGNWSTAAFWHRPEGVFAAWGSGVAPAAAGARATVSILDVAPTILGLLGLPADPRMPGAPVRAAFPGMAVPPRAAAPSDLVVRRVAAAAPSAAESSEYAKKLLALGYLSPGEAQPLAPTGGATPGMTEGAWNNLGVYLRENRKDFPAAQAAFEKSLALRPDYYSPMFNLAVLYRAKGDTARARGVVPALARRGRGRSGGGRRGLGARVREGRQGRGRGGAARGRGEAVPRERGDRARAGALPASREGLPGRPGGADALRGDDDGSRNPERPRALRDVPRAPRGGRAAADALAGPEARPAAGRPAARGRARAQRAVRGRRRASAPGDRRNNAAGGPKTAPRP